MSDDLEVELEYSSIGPVSATASQDGQYVVIDFPHIEDQSKALRLLIPSSQIENCVLALRHIQKALADPSSGIHLQEPH
jgi:hypothetical protein